MPPVFISAPDVEKHLEWVAMVDAIKSGHFADRAQISDQLLVRGVDRLLSRAAWIDGMGVGVKSVTVFPDNPHAARPSVQGAMLVFNDETGAVEAVIDSALVTRWKTAADSLLGASLLARPESGSVLIVGAGVVAESLVDAYRALFPEIEVSIWSRRYEEAQKLARLKQAVAVNDLQTAVRRSDIVSCATMATDPVLMGEWLQPGQHIDLIGAYTPEMREADDVVMQRGRVFVDCFETTVEHIGELMIPLKNKVIAKEDVLADFYGLTNGDAGRQSDNDITVFKNGGGAHLDLMTAHEILRVWQMHRP